MSGKRLDLDRKVSTSERHQKGSMFLTTLLVVFGLVVGQAAPAMATTQWNVFYVGSMKQGILKSGYAGMIAGGKAMLIVGTQAVVYIRTYGPSGDMKAQGSQAGAGPVTLLHAVVFDGVSKCMWTSSSTESRQIECQDYRQF